MKNYENNLIDKNKVACDGHRQNAQRRWFSITINSITVSNRRQALDPALKMLQNMQIWTP